MAPLINENDRLNSGVSGWNPLSSCCLCNPPIPDDEEADFDQVETEQKAA
ncbi:MAG: hypothetical protein KJ955_02270 [Nanoarchaeota archaeon]|nr:hypothetical protein [Nanoarchaeota archaeon]